MPETPAEPLAPEARVEHAEPLAAAPARRRGRLRRIVLPAVGAALLVALVVSTLLLGLRFHDQQVADDRRAEAVSVARQMAVNFTTFDYRNVDADLARVEALATGGFKDQYAKLRPQVAKLITDSKGVSHGQVKESAVVESSDSSAQVLVVVDAAAKNTGVPDGTTVRYRIALQLKRTGGHWLVTKLEPVA